MSVHVRSVSTDRREFWNELVEWSGATNPLYRFEALELQSANTGTELHALLGSDGETPVGLFPVFEANRGPITGAFSPAPRSGSLSLGPTLLDGGWGPQREQRLNCEFLDSCLDWIAEQLAPQYQQFLVAEYGDVRPFQWNGYDVVARFTYVVELTDEEDLLARFSRDARRNVRNADESAYTVSEGGADAVRYVVELARERHREQGIAFPLESEFAVALYRRLADGRVRPYVCKVGGDPVGGLLVLEHDGTVYRWHGGVKPGSEVGLPVNDLLDWHVIRDAMSRGVDRYDLVGAGSQSVNRYKAKFDPELRPIYAVRGGTTGLRSLVDCYSRVHALHSKLRGLVPDATDE